MKQDKPLIQESLEIIIGNLALEFPKYYKNTTNNFFIMNKIKFYINQEVTYITANIGKKEYKCHINSFKDVIFKINDKDTYDERVQILIYDALTEIYNKVLAYNNKEKIEHEKIIKRLFNSFIKRRKLSKVDDKILSQAKPSKIYI